MYGNSQRLFFDFNTILNPPSGLGITTILAIGFILGMLHGITPDEHTWPITFSYSVGSYSTRGGMKSGFMFSAGFTAQRAVLSVLGFLGLATIYRTYNLDGPVYVLVGLVMFVAGSYILKGRYLHLPLDRLFGSKAEHHSNQAERLPLHETEVKSVPLRMAALHGLVAGWGFGAYATIITFILAPQMPNIFFALLPGLMFGLGTMSMQVIVGAIFSNIMRIKKLTTDQLKYIGRSAAARTLYLGGLAFAVAGALIWAFPRLNQLSLNTGNPIPNLDSIGIATFLVIFVVGLVGFGSIYKVYREVKNSAPELAPKA
ncbi:MAG: hypothetical protein JRN20_11095 [Nitrososphaerota archaeon]|nr:hypothetical protein [Nitrososphaerota archaeon]MDG6923824.1 hypothetical protein [Nitrososphaerota archaeon]